MTGHKTFSVTAIICMVLVLLWLKVSTANAAPPLNDTVASVTIIPGLLFRDFLDVSQATTALDDPDCFGQGATVWYAFTPTQDMDIDANTYGSKYDTTLLVYTGSPGALNQIACNDNGSSGLPSQVRYSAISGQTYSFMVGSPSLPGGSPSLVFTVDVATPPPTHDDFANTIVIGALPFTDTRGATTATAWAQARQMLMLVGLTGCLMSLYLSA